MKLYRVTFQTEILVEAKDESEAGKIGFKYAHEEIENAEIYGITELNDLSQLRRNELGSLPWRSIERWGEPELLVEEILKGGSK